MILSKSVKKSGFRKGPIRHMWRVANGLDNADLNVLDFFVKLSSHALYENMQFDLEHRVTGLIFWLKWSF